MVDYCPEKVDPKRTRITVGGNLIEEPGDASTPTYDTTTSKIVCNSVVLTPKSKCMCIDILKNYLGAPLNRCNYLRIDMALIPDNIIHQYNLLPL